MAIEFEKDPGINMFAVFTALSAGGILELAGVGDPHAKEFVVASCGFAVSLPMSITGYLMRECTLSKEHAGGGETRTEKIQKYFVATLALGGVLTGLSAILSHFFNPSIFLGLSVAGVFLVSHAMAGSQRAQEARLAQMEIEIQELKAQSSAQEQITSQVEATLAQKEIELDEHIRIHIREKYAKSKSNSV